MSTERPAKAGSKAVTETFKEKLTKSLEMDFKNHFGRNPRNSIAATEPSPKGVVDPQRMHLILKSKQIRCLMKLLRIKNSQNVDVSLT